MSLPPKADNTMVGKTSATPVLASLRFILAIVTSASTTIINVCHRTMCSVCPSQNMAMMKQKNITREKNDMATTDFDAQKSLLTTETPPASHQTAAAPPPLSISNATSTKKTLSIKKAGL